MINLNFNILAANINYKLGLVDDKYKDNESFICANKFMIMLKKIVLTKKSHFTSSKCSKNDYFV